MVIYYINKTSEYLMDYRYPIKEGDVCLLYDGDVVKTIYIDSETDTNSIWHDFKFIDSKSLKSYQFPMQDSILCAPIDNSHAIGDSGLLMQLIQECKGEWLLDFLNETSAVLSNFVSYWDLEILRRLTGDDDVVAAYEDEEVLSGFVNKRKEDDNIADNYDIYEDDNEESSLKNYDIKWFCLSVLACLEEQMDKRTYQILYDTLNGDSRKEIAARLNLTQERIRQIVVKATKQAQELLIEQYKSVEDTKNENAKLNVQLNLLKEEIIALKAQLPENIDAHQEIGDMEFDAEVAELLETSIDEMCLSSRATNTLQAMGVKTFADIPQIESHMQVLKVRNSGRKTVYDISRMLKDFRLSFGMSYTSIVSVLTASDWQAAKEKWIGRSENKENHKKHKKRHRVKTVVSPSVEATKENPKSVGEVKQEEATIVLTRDIIEAARTPNGGFTKSQLAAINIDWPPPQDWIENKIGTMITPSQLMAFNHIEYVAKSPSKSFSWTDSMTYKNIASTAEERKKMEAILQAMTHFYEPATPRDIARSISLTAWGEEIVNEDTVDSFLKRLPEVEYINWGKYILKNRNE